MMRINENLMGESTIDWAETTVSDTNYSAIFNNRYYTLVKPPVSGILSVSADIEFITSPPENISAIVRVMDLADSSWRIVGPKSVPYAAGHRTKFEGLFDVGQVYAVEIGIYVGMTQKTNGNIARIRKVKVEDGSECTMWVTPESTLTPEQIALMKYGEVQDIKLQKAEDGKGLSTNDYTNEDKAKVDAIPASPKYTDTVTTINGKTGTIEKADITALGIPAQDTVYTHPSTHPASMITQDSARRMVSDTQIATWNGKVDKAGGQMTGALVVQPSGDTRQARNIAIGTTAPTSTTGYSEGDIFLVVP